MSGLPFVWPDTHTLEAWRWLGLLTGDARLIFSRHTQVGLLRILASQAAMGRQTLTLRRAWEVFDRWLEDPRVEFYREPRGLDVAFRAVTAPFAARSASKWVGDCYLLAFAKESNATLVTFDRALLKVAREYDYRR